MPYWPQYLIVHYFKKSHAQEVESKILSQEGAVGSSKWICNGILQNTIPTPLTGVDYHARVQNSYAREYSLLQGVFKAEYTGKKVSNIHLTALPDFV